MYTRRIQLVNYGPIEKLDIEFPFEGDTPKPVVLVGENGAGKSILLSHIVNGLLSAKGIAYPETPEVETGKVYKLRSSAYIKSASEYYFSRVDFDDGFFVSEIRSRRNKETYSDVPSGISGTLAEDIWGKMDPKKNDNYYSNLSSSPDSLNKLEDIFARNCVLYFPFNRFEEPAWLNEQNLTSQARYMDTGHLFVGQTNRKVIASSPLRENQDWLFGVVYDMYASELDTRPINLVSGGRVTGTGELFRGYAGLSTTAYEIARQTVRAVVRKEDAEFRIGGRNNRVVSLVSSAGPLVSNIFQMSSGETSLLNLFLSILRDFDLSGTPFFSGDGLRGVVVVDEIDLHLHAIHQYEVLPNLMQMFPRVQFIVTTHSPLFVLGMQATFGEDGFSLYRLPQGQQINAEEFSEFGDAYRAFKATSRFSDDVRTAIEGAQRPVVFIEGTVDEKYLRRASELLGEEVVFEGIEMRDGGGAGKLAKIWKDSVLPLTETMPQKVLLLFDCDKNRPLGDKGKLLQRTIPLQAQNPIKEGIENLFSKETLERARQHKTAFIDVDPQFTRTVRGEPQQVPEKWTINDDEKTNLCNWLCENGTRDDFNCFEVIFRLFKDLLDLNSASQEKAVVGELGSSESLPDGSGRSRPLSNSHEHHQ